MKQWVQSASSSLPEDLLIVGTKIESTQSGYLMTPDFIVVPQLPRELSKGIFDVCFSLLIFLSPCDYWEYYALKNAMVNKQIPLSSYFEKS